MLQVIVAGVVLAFLARLLAQEGPDIWRAMVEIGPVRGLGGFGAGAIGLWCGWRSWLWMLRASSIDLDPKPAGRLFFVSQLGKYVPGAVWPVVMQTEAARAHGLRRVQLVSAYASTILVSFVTGVAVAGVAFAAADRTLLRSYWWVLIPAVGSLILLTPRALPWAMSALMRALRRPPTTEPLCVRYTVLAAAWAIAGWLCLGLQVAILGSAFGPLNPSLAGRATGGIALAFVAGLLVVIAPAGAGVREVVLAAALGPAMSTTGIVAVVLISRVALIIGDVAAALLAVLISRRGGPRGSVGKAGPA